MAYTIENRPDELVVRAPRFPQSWFRYLWIPLMVAAVVGIVEGIYRSDVGSVLSYTALAILALLNCAAFYSEQQLVLNSTFLSKCENYWGVVIINRKMPIENTSHLRYVDVRPWNFIHNLQGLALDCDGSETRVLSNLEKEEVDEIIAVIRDRFPSLR